MATVNYLGREIVITDSTAQHILDVSEEVAARGVTDIMKLTVDGEASIAFTVGAGIPLFVEFDEPQPLADNAAFPDA